MTPREHLRSEQALVNSAHLEAAEDRGYNAGQRSAYITMGLAALIVGIIYPYFFGVRHGR